MATQRRPTYLLVQWKAPPSPYNGSYLLTNGPLGGMTKNAIATSTSYNITGLLSFTSYRVTVQASNVPDGEFPFSLSEVFTTLPDGTLPAGVEALTVFVPLFGDGSIAVIDIFIFAPTFQRKFLRYSVCTTSMRAT